MSRVIRSLRISTLRADYIIIACSIGAINPAAMTEKDVTFEDAETLLSGKILNLAQRLHKTVCSVDDKKNVLFSPLSIHAALSMLSAGVKLDSPSGESLLKILGYEDVGGVHVAYGKVMKEFRTVTQTSEQLAKENNGTSDEAISRLNCRPPVLDFWTMGVSNKIQLKNKFKDTLQDRYNTSMKQVTSEADATNLAVDVNKWAKDAGFGAEIVQPSDLILEGPKDLILLSAVKIQGWWVEQMGEYEAKGVFYNFGDPKQLVNGTIISNSDFRGKYARFSQGGGKTGDPLDKLEFRMAQIPLVGGLTFTIIEPLKNGSLNDLAQLESALLANGQASLLEKALQKAHSISFKRLQFPKIKFESDIDLKEIFEKLGLGDLFDKRKANLLDVASDPMVLSRAKHQAIIEVDKNGLKGGALTQMYMAMVMFLPYNVVVMDVKNPFLFMVRYKSLTLFMGKLVNIS